jgi:transposase-like protein
LYRAVDWPGNTLDLMLSAKREGKAAARFFRKVLKAQHTQPPRVITVDKNVAYPAAMDDGFAKSFAVELCGHCPS